MNHGVAVDEQRLRNLVDRLVRLGSGGMTWGRWNSGRLRVPQFAHTMGRWGVRPADPVQKEGQGHEQSRKGRETDGGIGREGMMMLVGRG